jgi:probable selenium-dependent hydroxylase accessory protein YqeC
VDLTNSLGITNERVIAIAGAGGKTTLLKRLAQEMAKAGRRVLLTSTTKIEPQPSLQTVQFSDLSDLRKTIANRASWSSPLLVVTQRLRTRLVGIPPEWVDTLAADAPIDMILAQTDGSSRRTFKAPLEHEPVIPASAEWVVTVLGADTFEHPLGAQWTHRPERVAELTGLKIGEPITPADAATVLLHAQGSFHNTPVNARRAVLINKVEGDDRLRAAAELAGQLRSGGIDTIILASLKSDPPVIKVDVSASPESPQDPKEHKTHADR